MNGYIISLDQGTTSSRALIFDSNAHVIASRQEEFRQIYPEPGWVEHDPMEILNSQISVLKGVIERGKISPSDIKAIGITNQRETTIVWDKLTGRPVYNAIVWQCRRTSEYCSSLADEGYSEIIREKTGLVIDSYFSATKVRWILENVPGAREKASRGELLFGTVDTWLIYNLTEGKVHATDYSNASRTMMFNIHTLEWDKELLDKYGIPYSMLPEVKDTSSIFGHLDESILGTEIPIGSAVGDQQSALFGQRCLDKGQAKNTYGTGSFMLMNTGEKPADSKNGLLTTIAWGLDGKVSYALEGSVFISGAVVQWLRDEMQLISSSKESEYFATLVSNNAGVYVVPAFAGLSAPHWDMYARGTITGLTRGTGKNHIIRASLESIAYQCRDLIDIMEKDSGIPLQSLRVDGGVTENNFVMQFQADMLGKNVIRPDMRESTALGAMLLAGLSTGVFSSVKDIEGITTGERVFSPSMGEEEKERLYSGWKKAVERTLSR